MKQQPDLGLTPYGQQQELYGKETPGDWTISQSDINQDGMGDCFLLSPLLEIIRQGQLQNHPTFISNMIIQNADGTETVRLFQAGGNGQFFTATPVSETVTNSFDPDSVNSNPNQDVALGGVKEIWPQVIEKAYAQLVGGYSVLDQGGDDVASMEALTGKLATVMYPFEQTFSSLIKLTNAHDLITFDTPWAPSTFTPQGLVAAHSYSFEGYASTSTIYVGNTWGPAAGPNIRLPIAGLSVYFDRMVVGHI